MGVTNTWTPTPGCAPAGFINPPIVALGSITLTYAAAAAQANFHLNTPDMYGGTYVMGGGEDFAVYAGGNRLALDDGTGFGGYRVDSPNNAIVLVYPAGAGEIIVIDILSDAIPPQAAATAPMVFTTEAITFSGGTATLSYLPNGQMLALFVNGMAFFPVGSPPSFSYAGKVITWTDPLYTPTQAIAVYSHA